MALLAIVASAAWVLIRASAYRSFRPLISISAAIGFCFWLAVTQWPLRISFLFARPALERIADDAEVGRPFQGPQRAGLFTIERVEVRQGNGGVRVPFLITRWHPSGPDGFARCAGMPPICPFWKIDFTATWTYIGED